MRRSLVFRVLTCVCLLALWLPAHAQVSAGDTGRGPQTITEAQRRELERIGTLGYTVGGDHAPPSSGLTLRDGEAYEGYTVYVSADFAGAFLLDMDGNTLHTWRDTTSLNWTRVWVYPDGCVLGVTAYPGRLLKLDSDSEGVWMYGDDSLVAHHDVRVSPDGSIYAVMRVARQWDWYRDFPILNDMVCILDPRGSAADERLCLSIPKAFHVSRYSDWVTSPEFLQRGPDPFHTNTVEVLDGAVPHPAFKSGNILITVRNMDCIAVLDPGSEHVVWANRGRWQRPHEARVTPEGRLLLFDNRKFDGQSRVVEYDVVADEIVWEYTEPGFFTPGSGAAQLLPNDNVLITESRKGRIFEVTREGRVVWEYWNPRTTDGGDSVVRITRAFRLPYDYFEGAFAEHLDECSRSRGARSR